MREERKKRGGPSKTARRRRLLVGYISRLPIPSIQPSNPFLTLQPILRIASLSASSTSFPHALGRGGRWNAERSEASVERSSSSATKRLGTVEGERSGMAEKGG